MKMFSSKTQDLRARTPNKFYHYMRNPVGERVHPLTGKNVTVTAFEGANPAGNVALELVLYAHPWFCIELFAKPHVSSALATLDTHLHLLQIVHHRE